MKEPQTRIANIVKPANNRRPMQISTLKGGYQGVSCTMRVEAGVIQINNISRSPEEIPYTLMTQNPDGSTELVTRDVSLAPFQVIEDQAEGKNILGGLVQKLKESKGRVLS